MACYAKNVIATAISEIGYQETPKGSNHNKFAEYIDNTYPDFYNGKKSWKGGGAEWCDIFVDYCIIVNSSSEDEALNVLCQTRKSAGAGCSYSYGYYKKAKRTGTEPKLGAQIFFGSGEKPTHTGIVVEINNDTITTVEGNSGDQVKKHTYKWKTSKKIFGYGYPRYTEEEASEPVPAPAQPVEPPKPVAQKYRIKTNSGLPLRMREQPTTKSGRVTSIDNGKTIEVGEIVEGESIGGNSKWAKASYKGMNGYCSMKYLVKV